MKKLTTMLLILATLGLVACTESNTNTNTQDVFDSQPQDYSNEELGLELEQVEYSYEFFTFEEALLEFASDVVIAQYVGSRPIGDEKMLIEHEFIVKERLFGNSADKIFVYSEDKTATFPTGERTISFNTFDLSFDTNTRYLLPIRKMVPFSKIHLDGFVFVYDVVIDLDNPAKSRMYSESLDLHSEKLRFDEKLSQEEIVSHIKEVVKDNTPGRRYINIESSKTEDIVNAYPHVLVIEVGELLTAPRTYWGAADNYYATAIEILKGDVKPEQKLMIAFPADTVKRGERYIIAAEPLEQYNGSLEITSENGLFEMVHFDEIAKILGVLG